MYLMYVDESGDCGLNNSPTNHFILAGLIIHELSWRNALDRLIGFRRRMKKDYGLKLRQEIHAFELINRPGSLSSIKRYNRLAIIRQFAKTIAQNTDFNIIIVDVEKNNKKVNYNVFEMAWTALIQRFENTIYYKNFPGGFESEEKGIIFPDNTDNKKLITLLRKMRRYNPIPHDYQHSSGSRNLPLTTIVEDPNFRKSDDSYFIQAVDMISYLYHQKLEPCSYMKKKRGNNYFNILSPILCPHASKYSRGIVRL